MEGDCLDQLRLNRRLEVDYLGHQRRISRSLEDYLDRLRIRLRQAVDCSGHQLRTSRRLEVDYSGRQRLRGLKEVCSGNLNNRPVGYSVQTRNSNNPSSRPDYSVVLAPVRSSSNSNSNRN